MCSSLGAWIVTGGTNTGVMEHVGQAIKDHLIISTEMEQPIVALGITPWGIVDNRETLTNPTRVSFSRKYAVTLNKIVVCHKQCHTRNYTLLEKKKQ